MATTLIDVVFPLESPVPAIVYGSTVLSRQQLFDLAKRTAQTIAHPTRKVFALNLKNTAEFVVSFLAVTGQGGIAAPLNSAATEKDAKEQFVDAKVDVLIIEDEQCGAYAAAKQLSAQVTVYLITKTFDLVLLQTSQASKQSSKAPFAFPTAKPKDVALYLFTSGTTSKPKLVPLTNHNMITSIANIRNTYELDELDKVYSIMPLFHIHGLQSALFASLLGGGTVILPAPGVFSASIFWQDVVTSGATWYTAVPTMHQILLARAKEDAQWISKHKLRFIRSCSSPLAPAVLANLESLTRVPVLEAYAMTEASHQMCSNPLPHHGKHKPGSVGRPTNVQLKISSTSGEVLIRGDNVLARTGYLNVTSPQVNIDAFEGSWFRTGDIGYLDGDGYLFLVGRSKEMVNRGGEKISPFEIDSALLEMTGVSEAVCFGMPSEKYGEELYCAAVVKSKDITEQAILQFAQTRLTKVKIPTRIFIVDSVPKTATGKIQRRLLTTHFANKSKL
ncbi:hypothetical protein BASA81_004178 [Batrachochytrium salamandrivorans]|nr:hypothetical protein BASA81_004178 [Batrachochytrium salamandrivorans]